MGNKTKICCLDVDKSIIDFFSKDFDVYDGSLGKKVRVNNNNSSGKTHLILNYNLPDNLHEYDILIDDMLKSQTIEYIVKEHERKNITGNTAYYFVSRYPENIFNPIPCACDILKHRLGNKKDKPLIKIVFHNVKYDCKYVLENISRYDDVIKQSNSNYEYLKDFSASSLDGTKVKLCNNQLSSMLFNFFLDNISYKQTYQTPYEWDNNNRVDDKRFLPLLENQNGDIISYAWISDDDITFMFPQMDKETKIDFLDRFFNDFLYKHFSDYFPTIKANAWTTNKNYYLPNHEAIIHKKVDNRKNFEAIEKQLDDEISYNQMKYKFLHQILTETDNELVNAIIEFLKWLGFENPIAKDDTSNGGILEEDIQIDLGEKGLLIIETKGIGGTSKDSECSQINKIKFRRCEERGKFDVYALYIVNNERHIEPIKRTIPPFNPTQIQDAKNEKRGMVYTWQLFNLFFNIENGFITKDEARERMLKHDLVDFTPELKNLGEPYKYYEDNKIVCVDLKNEEIKLGDFLAYEINGRFYKQKIIAIQQNKQHVSETSEGKTGIELESIIPNIKKAYLIKHE